MALTASAVLGVYPSDQSMAAVFGLAVDLGLLVLAARGRQWALNLLTAFTVFGALLFLTTGAFQVASEPRYLLRGVAETSAAVPLFRAWRATRFVH
ncbi:MAG TPA: hypothetical protein VFR33_15710 [Candidatus Dormibacteraeota bacterium]|nr:hypothetical protein [Candidatus Dormibacteraeota bacterium]